jgi:hypothetical protein
MHGNIPAAVFVVSMLAFQADTTVVLGHAERDLTGDGKPEVLRVVGVGPTIYDLGVTFTIESAGKTIYRYDMGRMTRTVGFDGGRHVISEEQHRTRIKEFGPWFFGKEKFQRPQEFVEFLRASAREHIAQIPNVIASDQHASETVSASVIWEEIQQSPVTIFTFSPGGDRIEAIAWNARAGRFYRLFACC